MPNCETIDCLVTPYIDDQLTDADRHLVDEHARVCPPCRSRIVAEQAVRTLIQARRAALVAHYAPDSLHAKCRTAAARVRGLERASERLAAGGDVAAARSAPVWSPAAWRARLAPLALAASLVLIVGVAFVYQLTAASSRVMAAELAADHLKCFAMNDVLHTHQDPGTVESSMWAGFGWRMRLPSGASDADLELVGSRPCLYGEGKIAHIMYRHHGQPVSLFMLPRETRPQELIDVLGHRAAIWCDGDRTFVLIARESKQDVERMAATVQATMR